MSENQPEHRAAEIVLRLPSEGGTWVEVGVWRGDNARRVMRAAPPKTRIVLVDPWVPATSPDYIAYATKDALATEAQMHRYYKEAMGKLEPWRKRARVLRMTSVDAAAKLAAEGFKADLVFIDSEHTYPACMADIQAWSPLVVDGGWIGGHDYGKPRFEGVTRAVDEMFGKDVIAGADSTWWVRNVL